VRALSPDRAEERRLDLDRRALALRALAGAIDLAVAPTRFAGARAVEFGVPAERVRTVRHGVDLPWSRREGPRRRFGYVGGLADHKGVHVLLEAFRRLRSPDLVLSIHGDPSVHPEYAARLWRCAAGDPRIRFLGRFPEGEQERVMSGLDVVVVPSLWWENSPFTLLEARASGAWVVASRTGGVPEILPPGAGRLVSPGDVTELAAALEEAASVPGPVLSGPPPRTLADEAAELEGLYLELRGRESRT
jgi:glycosyltransferase involved in cell wall biosynthesis